MKHAPIHSRTRVRHADGIATAEADGELVMMSLARGYYYGLNATGHRIWTLIRRETTVADVCATLRAEFEVDADTCEAEVVDVLTRLARESLIQVVDA